MKCKFKNVTANVFIIRNIAYCVFFMSVSVCDKCRQLAAGTQWANGIAEHMTPEWEIICNVNLWTSAAANEANFFFSLLPLTKLPARQREIYLIIKHGMVSDNGTFLKFF